MAHHKEGKVERYFVEQVKEAGGTTRKVQWIGRRGCPDQFFAFPRVDYTNKDTRLMMDGPYREAQYGFVEIKAPGGKLDGHQEREIARLRALDVVVHVLSSTEDVDWFIRSYT